MLTQKAAPTGTYHLLVLNSCFSRQKMTRKKNPRKNHQHSPSLLTGEAIKVTLQYKPDLQAATIQERNDELIKVFQWVEEEAKQDSVQLDLTSISAAAQTVDANIPQEKYAKALRRLKKLQVRVDPIVLRQLV
jgi:hypothetical protein